MRRWVLCLALLPLACAPSAPPIPPPGTANAVFTAPDAIEVTVSDYIPVHAVTLVGPQGELPAAAINTQVLPAYAPPPPASVGFGFGGFGFGRGGGAGAGIGFDVPVGTPPPVPPPLLVSTATLHLPAQPPYASVWQQSQIRAVLGEGPNVKYITVPAPPPPG